MVQIRDREIQFSLIYNKLHKTAATVLLRYLFFAIKYQYSKYNYYICSNFNRKTI